MPENTVYVGRGSMTGKMKPLGVDVPGPKYYGHEWHEKMLDVLQTMVESLWLVVLVLLSVYLIAHREIRRSFHTRSSYIHITLTLQRGHLSIVESN